MKVLKVTNENYAQLDEEFKNAASIIINSINENIANGFDPFTLIYSDMPVEEAKFIIDMYLQQIASSLRKPLDDLKIRLGFDDIYNITND